MKRFSTMVGYGFGIPLVIVAITGTVAGVARAHGGMGAMAAGCQADTSGPSLKELISTLKGQSAAPRAESKTAPADAAQAGPERGSTRTVTTVADRKTARTGASAAKTAGKGKPSGKSTTAASGTSGAKKQAASTAGPARTGKAAATKKSSGSVKSAAGGKKVTDKAPAGSGRKATAAKTSRKAA